MNAIILAAGYATRLYPLGENIPKPLLPIAGEPNIEYILSHLSSTEVIDIVFIVTNHKFYQHFINWRKVFVGLDPPIEIDILNDGTTNNQNRLGSIGDIDFVISKKGLDDDLLIIAGDSFFDFDLKEMIGYFFEKNNNIVCAYRSDDIATLRRRGVIKVDSTNRVINFEEKPKFPKSNIAVPAIHIYKKNTLHLFRQYLSDGNNPDAPGYFIDWIYKKQPLYAYFFKGNCYDIGDLDTYKKVNQLFS